MRRQCCIVLTAALAAFAVHCSLTVSPGDYTSGLHSTAPPASDPSHVMVVAGLRDKLAASEVYDDIFTADVWTARIGSDGVISGWTAGPSTPFPCNTGTALLRKGALFVVGTRYSIPPNFAGAEWISTGDPTIGPTWGMSWVGMPDDTNVGLLMTSGGLVVVGGYQSGGPVGQSSGPLDRVLYAPFQDSNVTFAPPQTPSKLVHPRSGPMVADYHDKFMYVLGGEIPGDLVSATVEVAPLGSAGPGAFADTNPMQDSVQKKPYQASRVAFCAGDKALYAVGGQVGGAPSPVVLMATLDEGSGQLVAWQSMPLLPTGGLQDAGCFVAHDRLYVVGGQATTTRTAQVISAPILTGGALGPWDLPADKPHEPLPAPRSQIAVAAY